MDSAEIEPELLTNLFNESREKRRPVKYADLPQNLVNALLAAEDKRFFEHPGFDAIRVAGAALADMRHGGKAQGASTLDMQLARSFFFTTERTWHRKVAETMVALELEHRFSKQQIFELYSNEIYLGNRGSFAIHGFGEASEAYFGKNVARLSLEECAFLTGIIRRPNHYSTAEQHPDRVIEARDHVLTSMVEDKLITSEQEEEAKEEAPEAGAQRIGRRRGALFRGYGEGRFAGPLFRSENCFREIFAFIRRSIRPCSAQLPRQSIQAWPMWINF